MSAIRTTVPVGSRRCCAARGGMGRVHKGACTSPFALLTLVRLFGGRPHGRSVLRLHAARDPPAGQEGVDLLGDEVSGAVAIVTLFQQLVVFCERVPPLSD